MRDWERENQREKEREIPWGKEHEHRASSIKHWSSSTICNEGRSAMRDGAPSTERSAMRGDLWWATMMTTKTSKLWQWRASCKRRDRGFGLLCIGVWFALYWDWGLVCSVLGFGLLCIGIGVWSALYWGLVCSTSDVIVGLINDLVICSILGVFFFVYNLRVFLILWLRVFLIQIKYKNF